MRFSEGLFAAQSAATLVCSLSGVRKFREWDNSHFARHFPWAEVRGSAEDLLLYDPDFDLGVDIGMKPDRDSVDPKGANRLV
jgi:hypothetical protein